MGSVVVAGGVCKIKHFLRLLDFIQKLRYTRNRAGGRMQARLLAILRAARSRTISGKKMRGTIWSTFCSRSMPVTFATRAAGSNACYTQAQCGNPCAEQQWWERKRVE